MGSPNAKLYEMFGLLPGAHDKCDELMPALLEIVRKSGDEAFVGRLVQIALFQTFELPRRTEAFQRKVGWKPPKR